MKNKDALPKYQERWRQNINTKFYNEPLPCISWEYPMKEVGFPDDQHILRMLVKTPNSELLIPNELLWLKPTIEFCQKQQIENGINDPRFIYVTVRCGMVTSKTDDLWHVDGFSTEMLNQPFLIPDDFDPFRHNIHMFFQDRADLKKIDMMQTHHLNLLDPYMIHRRPVFYQQAIKRNMFRITFVPIEIEDDTCQQNYLLPTGPYFRKDIRDKLIAY